MLRLRKRVEPEISMCGICGRVNSHNHVNADGDVLHTFIHPADSITEPGKAVWSDEIWHYSWDDLMAWRTADSILRKLAAYAGIDIYRERFVYGGIGSKSFALDEIELAYLRGLVDKPDGMLPPA